jgi:hypothetical protein
MASSVATMPIGPAPTSNWPPVGAGLGDAVAEGAALAIGDSVGGEPCVAVG